MSSVRDWFKQSGEMDPERLMREWPDVMAKGPMRFAVRQSAPGFLMVVVTFQVYVALNRHREDQDFAALVAVSIAYSLFMLVTGASTALHWWRVNNLRYAEETKDPIARAWATVEYHWPTRLLVTVFAAVLTYFGAVAAWRSGAALWVMVGVTAAIGLGFAIWTIRDMRRPTPGSPGYAPPVTF